MSGDNRPIIDTATMCEFIYRGILDMKEAEDGSGNGNGQHAPEAQDLHDGGRKDCAA